VVCSPLGVPGASMFAGHRSTNAARSVVTGFPRLPAGPGASDAAGRGMAGDAHDEVGEGEILLPMFPRSGT